MSRVRGRAAPARPARLQDRPGRWKLIWRNQRRRLRSALLLCIVLGSGFATLYGIQALGDGSSLRERVGDVAASLGLRVDHVVVEGRTKTPEAMLRAALGIRPGEPILSYSLSEARQRLESIKWVDTATVERHLPATIRVRLTERRPFAVWQTDGKFLLVDRDGATVTESDVAAFADQLPLVVGTGAPAAAAALMDLLAGQPELQKRMVAAVRVGERRWNLRMTNGADVMLPETGEAAALARLAELQAHQSLLDRPLAVVDLRLPDRLVVRPPADPKPSVQGRRT
ncbi:MAG: FtsQ-type POTRA domain-containing protein [Acetobacteraceae bacterium]|nr:FtsQ-type POTRA domain-containing protein [Acetobacteraceae bacterium]